MEDNNPDLKKEVTFDSGNLANTKAKEKREIFVNVGQKSRFGRFTAKNKQENNNTNFNGKPKKPFPTKKVVKLCIPIIFVLAIGAAIYLNWSTIYYNLFEVSETRSRDFLENDPKKFISVYDAMIKQTEDNEEKAILYLERANKLEEAHPGEYVEQYRNDVYAAEGIYPTYTTAEYIIRFEETYGSETTAEEWRTELSKRKKGEEIIVGDS